MDTTTLIEAVKNHPQLWGRQVITADQKNKVWKEIAEQISQPVEKCKAKWRNLRDSYQKNVKYREELREIGKMSLYHEYKHEAALSFLETGTKRKSDDRRSRSGPIKRSRPDLFYEYSPAHAVEYLIETDNNESQNEEDEVEQREEESSFQENSGDEEPQMLSDVPSEQIETDNLNHEVQNPRSSYEFEVKPERDNESYSMLNEDVPFQIVNDQQTSSSNAELDSWIGGIKETLLSLPKLLRARAKKQINDLVSEFEISYLESKENDNRE